MTILFLVGESPERRSYCVVERLESLDVQGSTSDQDKTGSDQKLADKHLTGFRNSWFGSDDELQRIKRARLLEARIVLSIAVDSDDQAILTATERVFQARYLPEVLPPEK